MASPESNSSLCLKSGFMVNSDFSSSRCLLVYSTDCISLRPFGLAATLPSHYGYGSVHESRRGMTTVPTRTRLENRGIPGTIKLFHPPPTKSGPSICAMFAQYGIGMPLETNTIAQSQILRSQERAFVQGLRHDTTNERLSYFKQCLIKLEEEVLNSHDIKKIIFPAGIGWRGMVDSHWSTAYRPLLHKLSERLQERRDDLQVILLSLENNFNNKKRRCFR